MKVEKKIPEQTFDIIITLSEAEATEVYEVLSKFKTGSADTKTIWEICDRLKLAF